MITPPPTTLRTRRLALRKPVPADAGRIFERWAQDPDITRYLVWRPHSSIAESERHIAVLEPTRHGRHPVRDAVSGGPQGRSVSRATTG